MRVLQVCARFLPEMGGIETHVAEVCRRIAAGGDIELTVLTTDVTRRLPEREERDGFTVLRVPAWPPGRDYRLAPRIRSEIRGGTWDLVHCQGVHTAVPPVAMTASRAAGLPYVVTCHTGGHSSWLRHALRGAQWRLLGPQLRRAARVIAVSRFEAGLMRRYASIAPSRITVINNGGELPVCPSDAVQQRGKIVSSGRLERYKGHQHVIRALPHVRGLLPDARLEILGAGPYGPRLRRIAASLGVADLVTIRHIPPSDRQGMAIALASAQVVAAFSEYEANPVAVIEALAAGRPVVGYATAGMLDLVEDGLVRGIAPGTPPHRAAAALVAAMTDPRPPATVAVPTWDACAEAVVGVYQRVLAAGAS